MVPKNFCGKNTFHFVFDIRASCPIVQVCSSLHALPVSLQLTFHASLANSRWISAGNTFCSGTAVVRSVLQPFILETFCPTVFWERTTAVSSGRLNLWLIWTPGQT
jgi:hypothetical protein